MHRSTKHIRAQVIDDQTAQNDLLGKFARQRSSQTNQSGGNIAASKVVGKIVAERAKEKGVEKVVFDRGGYQYHGRVQALAEAAREAGLKF